MYGVMFYSVYLCGCCVLAAILLFTKKEDRYMSFSYYDYLKMFATVLLMNVPTSVVLLRMEVEGRDASFLWREVMPFVTFMSVGVVMRMMNYHLGKASRRMKVEDGMMTALFVVGLFHPLLYAQSEYADADFFEGYVDFLNSPTNSIYHVVMMSVGVSLMAVCVANFVTFGTYYLVWKPKSQREEKREVGRWYLVHFALPLMAYGGCMAGVVVMGAEQHAALPLCTGMATVVALVLLNGKKELMKLKRMSIQLQIEREKHQLKSRKADGEEWLKAREYALIQASLAEWSDRIDHPCMRRNTTLADVASATGIPEGVIASYLNSVYCLYFEDYVQYLRKMKTE